MIIAAVERSLLLLEYMAGTGQPVSLGQVADACSLPKPSAYRILGTLQEMGYISRPAGTREYQVGPRYSRLSTADPYGPLKRAALPFMRRLQKQFDETVNLGVLSGKEVLYLDFVETTQPLRMVVAPGESDPYYCTALGLAIASQWPDAALDRLLEETRINRRTTRTAKSRMAVMAKIRRTRELGYAEECGEAVEGVACLGLSLGALGYPAAALSIAIPLQRLAPRRKREIIAALLSLLANDPSSMR